MTDLLGSRNLCLFSQHSSDDRAHDEEDTLAGVHCIHVGARGSRVSNKVKDMVEKHGDVPLQPQTAHALDQLHIGLVCRRKKNLISIVCVQPFSHVRIMADGSMNHSLLVLLNFL